MEKLRNWAAKKRFFLNEKWISVKRSEGMGTVWTRRDENHMEAMSESVTLLA